MNLFEYLRGVFSSEKSIPLSGKDFLGGLDDLDKLLENVAVQELALASVVNLIGNAISKCEFKTFDKKAEAVNDDYYRWNIEPNQNQNSSAFLHEIISRLVRKGECLVVVMEDKSMLVADSFTKGDDVLRETRFTDVTVGAVSFARWFEGSDCMYFSMPTWNVRGALSQITASYAELIKHTMKTYKKSRGNRGIFKYRSLPVAGSDQRKMFDELINNRFRTWLEAGSGAIALGEGQDWQEIGSKTYSSEGTRDIRAMIDDVSDFVAKAYGIPPALLRGNVQGISDALEQFLTFCIDPLADMLGEEINRRIYGSEKYKSGTFVKIDTRAVKHIDLLSVSAAIDKLIASGAFSVNEIRVFCGEQRIEEEWADRHLITRNYQPLIDALEAAGGGEN